MRKQSQKIAGRIVGVPAKIFTRYLLNTNVTYFFLSLFFKPEDGGDVSLKRRLTFNGLHSVISQKIELFTNVTI
jgi:hypothetical protein